MSGFFSKLFGGKKKEDTGVSPVAGSDSAAELVEDVLQGLIERANLDLRFEIKCDSVSEIEEITIDISGEDENLLTEKEGALLDSFQLFVKRVLQHQMPNARVNVSFDSGNFREESSKALVELAERLKEKALEQGRSVYLRALPPKDRKTVHQYLAGDDRVRSRSVGDGLYKKIKIYPVKVAGRESERDLSGDEQGFSENEGRGRPNDGGSDFAGTV